MITISRFSILFVLVEALCLFRATSQEVTTLYSPNKDLSLDWVKTDSNYVFHCRKGTVSMASLRLGMVLADEQYAFDKTVRAAQVARNSSHREYLLSQDCGDWKVRFRLYNDAFAFRYESERATESHVMKELSSCSLSPESTIWYFERKNAWKLKSYAGLWEHCKLRDLYRVASTPTQGTPILFQLPTGEYGFLSEAALSDYSGLRLKVDTVHTFAADFTEGGKGFSVPARFKTPWRILYIGEDLNALVNQQVIQDLSPKPDKNLFADTDYIQPGKCAWRWFSKGTGTPAQEREVIDAAARLDFRYSLVDDGWKKWPDCWEEARKLVAYARTKNVKLFFWQHSGAILDTKDDYASMRSFLDSIACIGASGIKVDFMDSEAKPLIDFENRLLKECAKRSLLVNFHGCQKPAGEAFTYPNELTREGIRGLELNKMREGYIPAYHNAALPFTRLVVGHGDYTPLSFTVPGTTSFAHQLATLVCFHSPLQTIAEDLDLLLNDPHVASAVGFIREVPTTWDEVKVLPPSEIGKLAVLAKRKGKDWYIGVLNGESEEKTIELDLTALMSRNAESWAYVDDTASDKVLLSMQEHRPAALERLPSVPFKVLDHVSPKTSLTLVPDGGAVIVIRNK